MKRLLAALTLLVAACTGTTEPIPPEINPTTPTTNSASTTTQLVLATGDDLVTEDELIFHAAEHTAVNAAKAISYALAGNGYFIPPNCTLAPGAEPRITTHLTTDWAHRYIQVGVDLDGCSSYDRGTLLFHWNFGDAVYVDGEVEQGDCRKLPGAGTALTGEYRELTNDTDDPVKRTISHTVEESDSVENSLNESLELTNGQTIEAGGSVPGIGEGKATVTFEQKFGIQHGTTKSSTKTHSETVEDESEVLGGHVVSAAFTTDDSVTECALNIRSDVDWSTIDLRLYRHHCGHHCKNAHLFIHTSHRNWTITFNGVDDIRRLLTGHLPTVDDGAHFDFGTYGKHALAVLGWPQTGGRQINFTGTRRTTIKDSASVIFKDITGKDHDCVDDVLTTAGTAVSDLDDKLAAC